MPTVKDDFKRELQHLMISGFKEALATASPDWQVREKSSNAAVEHEEFFMLTISSQLFRVIVVMHFSKAKALEQLVVDSLKIANQGLDDYKFYDYLGEVGNAFCGSIKRELGRTVPTLGMSTPNRLTHACLKYVGSGRKFDLEAHAEASLNDQELLFASLYLCADENLNFDVKRSVSNEDDVSSGELEFF